MSEPVLKQVESKLSAVRPSDFKLAEHAYRRFNCVITSEAKEKLEDPKLWVNVAFQLCQFDEIRVVSDDHSFMATLVVTYSRGTDARLKLCSFVELEDVTDIEEKENKYYVKLCGPKKWCVMNRETGETIKSHIPQKSLAEKECEDHIRAMSS